MRISDWSSDVCSSDLPLSVAGGWLACALAFALWSYGKFNRMRLADPQLPGMAEYRLCHRHALYSALLWGALFWVQGPVPTLDHILSMWTIAVLMMEIGRAHV